MHISDLFYSGFLVKIFYAFLICPIHATFPTNFIFFDFHPNNTHMVYSE
jgi:hypothetical protein